MESENKSIPIEVPESAVLEAAAKIKEANLPMDQLTTQQKIARNLSYREHTDIFGQENYGKGGPIAGKIDKAYALGAQAFKDGKKCVPAQDKNVMELLKTPDGDRFTVDILNAWLDGWNKENLADKSWRDKMGKGGGILYELRGIKDLKGQIYLYLWFNYAPIAHLNPICYEDKTNIFNHIMGRVYAN